MRHKRAVSKGNISDIMIMGILVIAMLFVMNTFMNCIEMIQTKGEVSQLARRYLLKAETEGYISEGAKNNMLLELEAAGLSDIDLSGTTLSKVSYGESVTVYIRGKIKGEYEISEIKTSTAKF